MSAGKIGDQLQEFKEQPRSFMTSHPVKHDVKGNIVTTPLPFPRDMIEGNSFVTERDKIRQNMEMDYQGAIIRLGDYEPGRAPIEAEDRPDDLIDNAEEPVLKIKDMNTEELMTSEVQSSWSDSYWPIYQGCLGARYADPHFPSNISDQAEFDDNYQYVKQHPVVNIISSHSAALIDGLSPSEKYDLLIRDAKGTLTQKMWAKGIGQKVERWWGICHGWSPASYMLDRPTHSVPVSIRIAGELFTINFYPSDIKGLASLLWAQTNPPSRFIGHRCKREKAAVDEIGRLIDQDAFDTNPGTWHTVIVNQIGVSRRNFVMDATYDYEVWNQPVIRYASRFFNPQTLEEVGEGELEAATVARSDFTNDKFERYRSQEATHFVGICTDVTYVVETQPSHDKADSQENDAQHTVTYLYDLELDASGTIIGGEWYRNQHPDFLWTPPPEARALSVADDLVTGEWNATDPLPDEWCRAAQRAAGYGQPLAGIVEALIKRSRQ